MYIGIYVPPASLPALLRKAKIAATIDRGAKRQEKRAVEIGSKCATAALARLFARKSRKERRRYGTQNHPGKKAGTLRA
jgi:hypothetical protein